MNVGTIYFSASIPIRICYMYVKKIKSRRKEFKNSQDRDNVEIQVMIPPNLANNGDSKKKNLDIKHSERSYRVIDDTADS